MKVIQLQTSGFVIFHAGKTVDEDFATEEAAWEWADANIDDQVTDAPNWLSDQIKYREPDNAGCPVCNGDCAGTSAPFIECPDCGKPDCHTNH